jgi:hypothetical protein
VHASEYGWVEAGAAKAASQNSSEAGIRINDDFSFYNPQNLLLILSNY